MHNTTSVGLRMEDLAKIDKVVAVGGGHTKAAAALAVMSNRYQHVCITDEGAARLMYASLEGRMWKTIISMGYEGYLNPLKLLLVLKL